MLLIGLTGNIAAGKTAVSRHFAAWGATLIDADALSREAVAPSTPALRAIAARWGAAMLSPDGALDRAALRRVVFADPVERAALDAVKLARTKLPGAWPKGIRAWFEFLSVLAPDPEARKQAALLSFLSNVGVGRTDASTMVESGKSPARAARGLAGLAAPRGMLPSIGKPLTPKPKPTTKQGAVVVRDRVLSDGEKSALTTAGVVLAGVAVLGVGYVLVRRLGR
ncbi:MAG: dephospho-CoA kinase [Elusimicrobiota bacterium]